jgi:hypothetical protein
MEKIVADMDPENCRIRERLKLRPERERETD